MPDESLFYPFTLTRPMAELRIGLFSIGERKEQLDLKDVTDLVRLNEKAIRLDFDTVTSGRKTTEISASNHIINAAGIFIEEGAAVEHCFLNASDGPIYIGRNALVMEGSMLRGPITIGENAVVKMGTKIYGATSIGPYCTAGGEIKNSVMMGFSNKAHDGYLGDSVVGYWCNLGAGTSNSNIKNTAGNIKLKLGDAELDAGTKFGLLMGDYSRAAINTSFNTGTVIGVCCNVFANGLTPKSIPSFSWGCEGKIYTLEKAYNDIDNWKKFKGQQITETEKQILADIYKNL